MSSTPDFPDYTLTPNHPCWFQIPAHSVPRAVDFYRTALGFDFTDGMPTDPDAADAIALFSFKGGPLEKHLGGGIIKIPDALAPGLQQLGRSNVRLMAVVHFYVEDMEGALDKIVGAGGEVTQPRTAVAGDDGGYSAEFRDTEGNFHGLLPRLLDFSWVLSGWGRFLGGRKALGITNCCS